MTTRQLYTDKFRILLSYFDNNVNIVLMCPWKVYTTLLEKHNNWQTINTFIRPIFIILTKMPKIANQIPNTKREAWFKISDHCKRMCLLRNISNENTKEITVKYDDLIKKIDELQGIEQLVVALYTLIPLGRCEYSDLIIVRSEPEYDKWKGGNRYMVSQYAGYK